MVYIYKHICFIKLNHTWIWQHVCTCVAVVQMALPRLNPHNIVLARLNHAFPPNDIPPPKQPQNRRPLESCSTCLTQNKTSNTRPPTNTLPCNRQTFKQTWNTFPNCPSQPRKTSRARGDVSIRLSESSFESISESSSGGDLGNHWNISQRRLQIAWSPPYVICIMY